ncbi:MAG TPA: hypothetical protein VKR59_05790 [Terriglobales bacterium]|nr:hypothetical protein [Terriglobales bacterium]
MPTIILGRNQGAPEKVGRGDVLTQAQVLGGCFLLTWIASLLFVTEIEA